MENLYPYLAFLLSLLLLVFHHFLRRKRKRPPSPLALPIIGHLHLIKNQPHLALQRLASKYGPILFLRLGSLAVVVVSSPSAVQECFTKNDIIFANRPRTLSGDYLTYNYTVVIWASYCDLWRDLRRLTSIELFSSRSLQKSSIIRKDETRNLISHLLRISRIGIRKLELRYWLSLLTFNIITRLAAGKRCVADGAAGTEEGKRLLEGLKEVFAPRSPVALCDFFPILRWVGSKRQEKSMMAMRDKRDALLQGILDEFREKKAKSSDTGERNETLIQTLVRLQESKPEFYTDDMVKSIILTMFIGGTETSATTMERAILLLLDHPEAFQRLRAEIDNQIGHGRLIEESDLAKLPFLHCVINETLRLHPTVPLLLPHYSSEECTIGGFRVLRGTTLLVNAWAVHRDPKVWDEPEKFRPGRFEGERPEEFNFIPFGIGRRACPGASMAMRAVSLVVGALIQCFELENVGQGEASQGSGSGSGSGVPTLKNEASEVAFFPRRNALEFRSQLQNNTDPR